MARKTGNVTVEELAKGGPHRGTRTGAPAQETANARVIPIGPFRRANLTAGMSATAMTLGGVDSDAPVSLQAHSAGHIIGVQYQVNALVTAGGASAIVVQPTIAPNGVDANVAVAGNSVSIASAGSGAPQKAVVDQTAETPFAKGDALGMQVVSTNGGLVPATTDDLACWLLVRFVASPGDPKPSA